jgi:hypothetical protein
MHSPFFDPRYGTIGTRDWSLQVNIFLTYIDAYSSMLDRRIRSTFGGQYNDTRFLDRPSESQLSQLPRRYTLDIQHQYPTFQFYSDKPRHPLRTQLHDLPANGASVFTFHHGSSVHTCK